MTGIELLQALFDRYGDNANSIAEKLGNKSLQSQIYRYLGGISQEPRRSTLQPIADHYNISVEAFYDPDVATSELQRLASHTQSIESSYLNKVLASRLPATKSNLGRDKEKPATSLVPVLAWDHVDDLPDGEFVMLPRIEVRLSAGNGRDQHVEVNLSKRQPQAFRADWIRDMRLKPSGLACMTAEGSSMEPSIYNTDSVVVDTNQTEIIDGKVYALWYEGGERVKRLYRMPGGGLRIKSDNPDFELIVLTPDQTEHVRILGRVVHRAGRGGL